MLYRLRKVALFDASATENIDKICKYYGINRSLSLIISLISPRGFYK